MKLVSFLLALTAIGCGIEPESGTWQYDEQRPAGCGNSAQYLRDGDGLFALDNNGDGTFTVDPQDGGEIFDCKLDGNEYDCPERLSRTYDLAELGAGEGTGSLHVSVRGEFSANDEATGTQTGRLECAGSGCALAASQLGTTFPCTVSVEFAASTE
jgi:hypothetical protein